MVSRLEKFIATASPANPKLPVTHITSVANARSIFENGQLSPTNCPVLREDLLYFFYGKAEYRGKGHRASDLPGEKPVCFICNDIPDGSIFATFPFDSGAFYLEEGIKERFFPHIKDVLELNVGDQIENIQCLITRFFGNNQGYYDGEYIRLNLDPLLDIEAAAYLQILSSGGLSILDGRATTPEIVAHTEIPLTSVNYVVAPTQMKSSAYFLGECANNGIVPIYYNIKSPLLPREYISVIQEKIHELL